MLGERLRTLRNEKGYTLLYVADKLGLSEATLSNYEKSTRKPDWETINQLADFYNVSTDYLMGRTNIRSTVEDINSKNSVSMDFENVDEALKFILEDNTVMAFGGFDTNKLTDDEIIEFANALKNQIELLSYKYKR